jgi:hypothetical protein
MRALRELGFTANFLVMQTMLSKAGCTPTSFRCVEHETSGKPGMPNKTRTSRAENVVPG